jgi:hypothetical protein
MHNLNNVDPHEVGKAALQLINVLQDFRPDIQGAAIVGLFRTYINESGIDPRHALEQLDRVMTDETGKYWTYAFQAVREYVQKEIVRSL